MISNLYQIFVSDIDLQYSRTDVLNDLVGADRFKEDIFLVRACVFAT